MAKKQAIKLFEEKKVRTVWDDEQEKWYFSIVDVCDVLTESKDATAYWRKLKQRLKAEGNETVTNCHALKLRAADGKMRLTDVAATANYAQTMMYWHIGERINREVLDNQRAEYGKQIVALPAQQLQEEFNIKGFVKRTKS